DRVYITGNTVIDAWLDVVARLADDEVLQTKIAKQLPTLDPRRKLVLVTGHRRESFGGGFERICVALSRIAAKNKDLDIVYPVHLNPRVQEPVKRLLANVPNIYLIEPQEYLPFVYLM